MDYDALCVAALSYAARLVALAAVPFLASLARWRDVLAVAGDGDTSVGFQISLPHPLADLWTFVRAPRPAGQPVPVDAPFAVAAVLSPERLVALVAFVIATGLLMAGYVGSIDQFVRESRYDFLENVRRYWVEMVGVQAIVYAVVVFFAVIASFNPGLVLVGIVLGFLAWACFYLAPFLVVVEDRPLDSAFRRSLELVANRIEALAFLAIYVGLVLVLSIPLSIAVNVALPGVLTAALAASVFGLYLTVLTVLFARELVGADGPTGGPSSVASGPDVGEGGDRESVADGD